MKDLTKIVLISMCLFLMVGVTSNGNISYSNDIGESLLNPINYVDDFSLSADGDNWLTGWAYRQQINITGSAGAGTNYPVEIPFNYDATGVTGEVNFSSHCQTDFGDVRFTDGDGISQLDYWIEEKTDSDDGVLWVEVSDDLGSSQNIYVYYGTETTTTTSSSGDDTFLFFDDFENNNFDRWDSSDTGCSIVSDRVQYGSYSAFFDASAANYGDNIVKNFTSAITYDFMIHFHANTQVESATMNHGVMMGNDESYTSTDWVYILEDDIVHYDDTSYVHYATGTFDDDTWYRVELGVDVSASQGTVWQNRVQKNTIDLKDRDGNTIGGLGTIRPRCDNHDSEDYWLDDVIIRKWQASEPTLSTTASEESESAYGAEWLDGWMYRQQINITGVSGAGTNYPVDFGFNYDDAGITDEINFSSNCETDFADIRFTEADGETLLDYWIEEYTSSDDGVLWVEVSADLDETQTIYVYYGNSTVSTASNGEDVFYFFDDFENNNWDRWSLVENSGSAWTIQSTQKAMGTYAAFANGGVNHYARAWANFTPVTNDFMIHTWSRIEYEGTGYAYNSHTFVDDANDDADYATIQLREDDVAFYNDTTMLYYDTGAFKDDTWYRTEFGFDVSTSMSYYYQDRSLMGSILAEDRGSNDGIGGISKFRPQNENGGIEDYWLDDVVIRKWVYDGEPELELVGAAELVNQAPEITADPECTNLDDTDNLYAHYKEYTFTSNVSDADGYADITYVELSFMNGATPFWTVRFTEDDEVFNETLDTNNYITLETGSCSNVSTSTTINITFAITIHWNHTDVTDYDLKQYVVDSESTSDTDTDSSADIDVETRIDWAVEGSLSDGSGNVTRGNYNTEDGITASGTVIYYGSVDNYPPAGEVDLYVVCADCAGSPWSTLSPVDGAFDMTVDSDDVVGADTYYFVVYPEGTYGSGNLMPALYTTEYVADQIKVLGYNTNSTDNRDNVGTAVNISVWIQYDYDDTNVTDGSVVINGDAFAYNAGSGNWTAIFSNATASGATWDTVVTSGDTNGVTSVNQNSKSQTYIWDSYTVAITVDDNRIDVGTNATVSYTVLSDYDSQAYDGTVNLNYSTWTQASAQRQGFTVSSLGGDDTYGITTILANDEDYIIWDSYTISFTVTDNRIDINTNASVTYTVISDYDSIAYDGTVNLNYSTWTQASAQRQGFTVSSLDGDDTYGITAIGTNDEDYVIWDSYTVSFTVDDNRVDIGTNATVGYTVISDYDSIAYDGGITLNQTTWTYDYVTRKGVSLTLDGDDTYGITAIGTDDSDYVIWDQVLITLLSADDYRLDINTNVTLYASAIYDYDDTAVEDGTITLNSTTVMTWNGTHFVNETGYDSAIRYCFNVTAVSDVTYGITAFNWSIGFTPYSLYDYLSTDGGDDTEFELQNFTITLWYMAESYVDGIDDASGEGWAAWRNYGGTEDGGFLIPYRNWGDSDGLARWYGVYNNTDGDGVGYTFTQPADHVAWRWYFTAFTVNSSGYYWVWRDTTLLTSGSIGAAFYNWQYDGTGNLVPGAWGDYWPVHIDDMRFYNYTFSAEEAYKAYYGEYPSSDNLIGHWPFDGNFSDVTGNSHDLTYKVGDGPGIAPGSPLYVVWDSVTITITGPTDNRQDLNANATGIVTSAVYDYDGEVYYGILTLNNTDYDGDGTVVRWGYTVDTADGDDFFGITVISTNDDTYMIWDSLTITITISDQRIDIGDNATIYVTAVYDYDSTAYDGTLTLNDTTYDYGVVGIYYYTVDTAGGDDTYGITVISSNDADYVIFDALTAYVTTPDDQRINIGDNCTGLIISAIYEYDSSVYDGTLELNDTTYDYGVVGIYYYNVTTANGDDTYGITVISNNGNQTYCIFDALTAYVSTPDDQRIDVSTNCTGLEIWAIYEYDSVIYDGGLTLNDTTYNHTLGIYYYNVTVADGADTYGITVITNNGNQTYCIFDSVSISYTITDQRIDIGSNASIVVSVTYDYDSTAYDGTVNYNDTTYDYGTVGIYYYTVTSVDGDDTYGITVISSNDSDYVIFDALTAYVSVPDDQRIDIGDNCTGLVISAIYEYDSSAYDGTLELNDTTYDYGVVGIYYYNVTIANGDDTYGITVISNNGNQTYCIFDAVTAYVSPPTDQRIDISANASGMVLWAIHAYDSAIYNGTLTLNDTTYNYAVVGIYYYNVTVAAGDDDYGITVITNSGNETYCIFDTLTAYVATPDDQRININDNCTGLEVWATYDYDSTVYDGTLTLNDTTYNHGTVGIYYYNVTVAAGDDSYGITVITNNGNQTYCIFDEFEVYESGTSDSRTNIGETERPWFKLRSKYDSHYMNSASDSININGSAGTWVADVYNYWYKDYTYETVLNYTFCVTSFLEDTYGITALDSSSVDNYTVWIVWDALTAYVSVPDDQRININDNCTGLILSAIYEYDSTVYDGTLHLNDTTYNYDSVGIYYYNVTVADGDDTYAITVISNNGNQTYCIFDALTAYVSTPDDQRIDINANCTGLTISAIYEYDGAVYDGTLELNDTTYNHDAVGIYYYNVTTANGDDSYGITVITNNGNNTYCIFDALTAYVTTPDDQRIDINANCSGMVIFAIYEYDSTAYDGGLTLNDTTYNHDTVGIYYYNVTVADGLDSYGITVITHNGNETYCIFDALTAYVTVPDDQRININDNCTGLVISAIYEYDSTAYDGGLTLNDTTYNYGVVGIYYYNVTIADGLDSYGITVITNNGNETYCIFDALTAYVSVPDDQRIDINANCSGLEIWAIYEYDNAAYDGGLTLNDTTYNYGSVGIYYYNVTVADGLDTYGITVISNNGNQTYCIFDQIEVYDDGCDYTDVFGRVNVGQNVTLWANARLQYDNHELGVGDYIEFGGERMTWNGTHFTASYVQNTVGLFTYTINETLNYEDTYGITIGSNIPVNLIFDRILIYDMWLNDTYVSPGDPITIYASLVSEYDNESMLTGVVQLNGTLGVEISGDYNMTHQALANWSRVETIGAFANWTYIITWANWTTYNLTNINYNGWNVTYLYGISERIIVMGYTTNSTDNRDDINTYVNISIWLQYESDSTNVTDGVVVINGDSYTYLSGGNWTAVFMNSTASGATWDDVVVSGNARGITDVNNNSKSQDYIWDSYTCIITVGDNRIDINVNASISFTVLSDYDSLAYDGTTVLNYTTYEHATAQRQGFKLVALIGDDTYSITTLTNDEDYVIWDSLTAYVTVPDDQRINTGANCSGLIIWAIYDYDGGSYDGSLELNDTTYDYGTVGIYYYNVTTANADDTYGVSVISTSNTTYCIFDAISYTITTNTTWTIVTYYTNISWVATHDYDSTTFNGTANIANTSLTFDSTTTYIEITNTSVCNNTYYITSIDGDDDYGITVFGTTNTIYCIWDNITATADYYTEATAYTKVFSIAFGQLQWQYNGSGVGVDWICENIRNGTVMSTATTLAGSYLYPFWQEISLNTTWTGILYTNNATKTINGVVYDFTWYTVSVEVSAILMIRNLIQEELEDELSVSGTLNTNATYQIYNEGIISTGESGQLNVTSEGVEEGFQIRFDIVMTVGWHNFSIYFEAVSTSGGNLWFNQSYYVEFDILIEIPEEKGDYMEVKGTSRLDCSYAVYNRDDVDWTDENGTIEGGDSYFQFLFLKETAVGLHNYSLYFYIDSTFYVWKNGSYYVTGVYDISKITLYDGQSNVFEDDAYKIYVNDTRIYGNTFYNRTDYDFNITITDYFDYTVYSSVFDFDRFIDIELEVYTFKVLSKVSDGEYFYFNLTRSGGATFSQHILPGEILTYRLIAATYDYEFKRANGPNYDWYTGEVVLTADTTYIISDVDMKALWRAIQQDIGGRTNLKPIMAGLDSLSSSLSFLQASLWGIAAIIIGMMIISGYMKDDVEMKDGKPVKKTNRVKAKLVEVRENRKKKKQRPDGLSSWGVEYKD